MRCAFEPDRQVLPRSLELYTVLGSLTVSTPNSTNTSWDDHEQKLQWDGGLRMRQGRFFDERQVWVLSTFHNA